MNFSAAITILSVGVKVVAGVPLRAIAASEATTAFTPDDSHLVANLLDGALPETAMVHPKADVKVATKTGALSEDYLTEIIVDKFLRGSENADGKVGTFNCGNHRAASCEDCGGETNCNGECVWENWYKDNWSCFYGGQSAGGNHGVKCHSGSSYHAPTCGECYPSYLTSDKLSERELCNSDDCTTGRWAGDPCGPKQDEEEY